MGTEGARIQESRDELLWFFFCLKLKFKQEIEQSSNNSEKNRFIGIFFFLKKKVIYTLSSILYYRVITNFAIDKQMTIFFP